MAFGQRLVGRSFGTVMAVTAGFEEGSRITIVIDVMLVILTHVKDV